MKFFSMSRKSILLITLSMVLLVYTTGSGQFSPSRSTGAKADTVIFMGVPCTTTGAATFSVATDDTIKIRGLGSSGIDGLDIRVGPAPPRKVNLWNFDLAYPDSSNALPIGAAIHVSTRTSDGLGGEEEIAYMVTDKTAADTWRLAIQTNEDYHNYWLEGFSGGVSVFERDLELDAMGYPWEDPLPFGVVTIPGGSQPTLGFGGAGTYAWDWEVNVTIDLISGHTYDVDRIEVRHKDTVVCPPLTSVYLSTSSIPSLTMTMLGAGYAYGATHNAGLAYFHQNNPDWPPEGILTEADVVHVIDSVVDFMIAEAGYDSLRCRAVMDSMLQVEHDMGMFHDVGGTVYYGAPVVSDSAMAWRTDYLVGSGNLSRVIADVQVDIYNRYAAVRGDDDLESVLAYISGLPEMTWPDEDVSTIDMIAGVNSSSYDYWSQYSDAPEPWGGPWGGDWEDWWILVSYDDAWYHCGRNPINDPIDPFEEWHDSDGTIVSIYNSSVNEARKWMTDWELLQWFGLWEVQDYFNNNGINDFFLRYLITSPIDPDIDYGCLILDIDASMTSVDFAPWPGKKGSNNARLDTETYVDDGSGLPLLITSMAAEENDGSWDLLVDCLADSITMDCWLGDTPMLHRNGLSPLKGGLELLTVLERLSASIELNQRLLPSGDLSLSMVLPEPVLVSIPDNEPLNLFIDEVTLYTHGLNSTATVITQMGFLASPGLDEIRLTDFSATLENTIAVPGDHFTIQAAIDASVDGDVVLVDPGTYIETIDFSGKRITVASQYWATGDADHIGTTVIDGASSGTVVTFESGEDAQSVLVGFTITGGQASYAGGIRIADSNPTIHHCVVTGNTTTFDGAGIYVLRSSPQLRDLEVHNNTAGRHGGGINISTLSNPSIRRSSFHHNDAANGGGMWCFGGSSPTVENVEIVWNTADHGGGVFCYDDSSPHFSGVVISENSASVQGGGILCYFDSGPTMVNSILWGNSPQEGFFDNGSNNSLGVAYSDVLGGEAAILTNGHGTVAWLDGNMNQDPLFADPANKDFELSAGSPCIDSGIADFTYGPDVWVSLIFGQYFGFAPDLGAFEAGDQLTEVDDAEELATPFWVGANYPNPFNPTTRIGYSLAVSGPVDLKIFDVSGRLVRQLIRGEHHAVGSHTATWNGRDDRGAAVASGAYFYRLESHDRALVKKMMLLK